MVSKYGGAAVKGRERGLSKALSARSNEASFFRDANAQLLAWPRLAADPAPIAPSVLEPKVRRVPSSSKTALREEPAEVPPPAATATALPPTARLPASLGRALGSAPTLGKLASPSCPCELLPMAATVPSSMRTMVW